MGKIKIKRLAAFWLSIAMLVGSIFTSNNYSSLADQTGLKLLESFKVENGKKSDNNDTESIGAVKATASNDEITDGDVIDDRNATDSDAEIATDSNANALAIASLKATASDTKIEINKTPKSYINYREITGNIATPGDFAIGKAGTKTMSVSYSINIDDIPTDYRKNVSAKIVIPRGFYVKSFSIDDRYLDVWNAEYSSEDYQSADTEITFNSKAADIGVDNASIASSFTIVQDASVLINNLYDTNDFDGDSGLADFRFALKLYGTDEDGDKALIVKNNTEDETTSFSFVADKSKPDWDKIEVINNGRTYKPTDLLTLSNGYTSAAEGASYDGRGSISSQEFDKGLRVKYHKTKGYVGKDTSFKFINDALNKFAVDEKQKYKIAIKFTDDDYGNSINLDYETSSYRVPNYIRNSDSNYDLLDGEDGNLKLTNSALISNTVRTTDNIEQFEEPSDATPSNSHTTYSDILYRAGTYEICIIPLVQNKLFYDNRTYPLLLESSVKTMVEIDKTSVSSGDELKFTIDNGTLDQEIIAASAADSDYKEVWQYGTTDTYNDIDGQIIRLSYKSNSNLDWKVYDNFKYTIEYKAPDGREGALYPVKLDLATSRSDDYSGKEKIDNCYTWESYGLTYRIHIKDVNGGERIETIVGRKNSTKPYDYATESNANEIVIGYGLDLWDGTADDESVPNHKKLSDTEYVSKIEIIKDRAAAGKFRISSELGTTTLRAQHYNLKDNTNISDSEVKLISTVNIGDTEEKTFTQIVKTKDTGEDNLEILKSETGLSIQVNQADYDNGILGSFTLRKYPTTMKYLCDKTRSDYDPPVVVLSGDGITLTDRITAHEQTLLYIEIPDTDGDGKDEIIDVKELAEKKCKIKTVMRYGGASLEDTASDYEISKELYSYYWLTHRYVSKGFYMGCEHAPIFPRDIATSSEAISTYSNKTKYIVSGRYYEFPYSMEMYDLNKLFEELKSEYGEIKYATKLVIAQDYVNDWVVAGTKEEGETATTFFFANTIEPGHLNYNDIVNIDSNSVGPVEKTYKSELYCKATYWLSNEKGETYTDSNGGNHKSQEQNISKIVYGNTQDISVHTENRFVQPILYNNTDIKVKNNAEYWWHLNKKGFLATIEPDSFSEDNDKLLIDYNSVIYNFDPDEIEFDNDEEAKNFRDLLSITTGIGVYSKNGGMLLLNIEYETSDKNGNKKTYTYKDIQFDSDTCTPLTIADGSYLTKLKITTSNEHFIWTNQRYSSNDKNWVQSALPTISLCVIDSSGIIPKNYPYSGRRVGTVKPGEKDGRAYDQLPVKCKVYYEDIFKKKGLDKTVSGLSEYIPTEFSFKAMSTYTTYMRDDTNTHYPDVYYYKLKDGVYEETSEVIKGSEFYARIAPHIDFSTLIGINGFKIRPVFYYAIDKAFTPNTKNILGLEQGAKASFYPAGTGNGKSGSDEYGYLVIDYKDALDSDLTYAEKKSSGYTTVAANGFTFGLYDSKDERKIGGHLYIPLTTNYDTIIGTDMQRRPFLFMWADLPYDCERDGSSGNELVNIDLANKTSDVYRASRGGLSEGTYTDYSSKVENTVSVPDIKDRDGNTISALKDLKKVDGKPVMLYEDFTTQHNSTYAYNNNLVTINGQVQYAVAPYVAENVSYDYANSHQSTVTAKDYTSINESNGIFSNIIWVINDSGGDDNKFDIYIPIVKNMESNKKDITATSSDTAASQFSLILKNMNIDRLKESVKDDADKNESVKVYFTTDINPGSGGLDTMDNPEKVRWIEGTASNSTGIKVSIKNLKRGAIVPFYINYQLSENKAEVGEQKGYQMFYYRYNIDGTETASSQLSTYILEDMDIGGFVWNETGKTPNSLYDESYDSTCTKDQVALKLYKAVDGKISGDALSETTTADDGIYTLLAPCDGSYIVKIATPAQAEDGADWGLVKKKVSGGDERTYSRADQATGATDALTLDSDYTKNPTGTLTNVNFGIYKMAKFKKMDNISVHAGDKATASDIVLEGNDASLGEDYEIKLTDPDTTDNTSVATLSKEDGIIFVHGKQAGKTSAEVSCTDAYGNVIKSEFDIYSYIRILYDLNGGTGSVTDDNYYYVEYPNRILSTGTALGSEGKLIKDTFDAPGESGITPPAKKKLFGWDTNPKATEYTYKIQKDSKDNKLTDYSDLTKDITLFAIYAPYDIGYKVEFWRQKPGTAAGNLDNYEHYAAADITTGCKSNEKATISNAYEEKFISDNYKFNTKLSATMSDAQEYKEFNVLPTDDGKTVYRLYYDYYEPIKWYDNDDAGDDTQKNSPIQKSIASKYGKWPTEDQTFTFTMTADTEGAPLPANNKATLRSKDILDAENKKLGIDFGNITYNLKDAGKAYTYTIKEVNTADIKNYEFDKAATGDGYTMTVDISVDEEKGQLEKKVTYSSSSSVVDASADGIVITNTYTTTYDPINWYDDDGDIEQDPPIKKAIVPAKSGGKLPTTEQTFTFTMEGLDGAPLPEARAGETSYDKATNTLTATLSTKDALQGIEFGNISFDYDDVGNTYEYVIKEVSQAIKNYTFDDIATGNGYTMTVKIASNSDSLTKEVTYGTVDGALTDRVTDDGITITNTYTASSSGGNGGGSGGGGSSSTGKHAVNPVNANQNASDEANGDKGHAEIVEPKPDDNTNSYKNWVWGLMPKTGEEAAKMGAMLLAMAGLVAVVTALVLRRKQKK